MAADTTLAFNDANFQAEVLDADQPVIVDFWAEWCMPCRMLAPTIDQLSADYAGKAKVGKLDTEDNTATALKYQIQSIPTVLLFKGGEVVHKWQGGNVNRDAFAEVLDQHV